LVLLVDEERHLGFAGPSACLRLARPLRRTFWHCYGSRAEWFAAVVGEPAATTLGWEDFAHLGPVRDLAARVVAGAGAGTRGINLLLHGPVGTGKTEFCKALAARTGRRVWSIGEADEEGGEPSRQERLAALHLVQRLLRRRGDALILFDEAEDLLAGGGGVFSPCERPSWGDGSKVYMNRLLEQNEVPVLWTCNAVGGMDPAVLRRMTLAVEIGTPNQAVRERIWDRVLTNSGVALDAGAIGRLASRYAAPPAVAANAVRAAALAGGGEVEIEQAMAGVLEILGIAPAVADANGGDFDPTLVNCREDIAALVDRIVAAGVSSPWSLCLYGPAGTGKSQFARHMAHRLGLEVFQRRASDLLSKWVGESEKQIARAFEMARARRMLLVIDEADSLLSDRRDAVQSWELTQVNEMLTWMESHPLPFVCTTNLIDRLDQASLRRFTFKLRFEALTLGQAALAFARFFGWPPPRPLADGLTPGDFATVRRRRAVLGAADAETLARWLDEEAEAKGARTMPIGFGRG
jgi:SpoVK/Ycf46/Vps4 family AAA+-type ATPase